MKEQVMYDDDQAAKQVTVTGWVSRQGRFYGDNEHLARWDGCTHMTCECGAVHEKGWTICETCRRKAKDVRYAALPVVEWDGKTPLCLFDDDKYFFSEDEVLDYCEEEGVAPSNLQLVVCEPQYAHQVDPDEEYQDLMPEDQYMADVAPEIVEAFNALNEAIEKCDKPLSWVAGTKRTAVLAPHNTATHLETP